jgi:branched-chain amino acid transport system substrate-binding protein
MSRERWMSGMFTLRKRPAAIAAAGVLSAGLALAACSSSASSGSSTPSASTAPSGSSASATTAASGTATGAATGTPIKVAAIVSETGPAPFVGWANGAQAYFKYINANGGIQGHPVQFTIVDDQGSPTNATELARKEVAAGIVAFVASLSLDDCAVNRQYYQQQNIVSIDIGSDPTCFDSPNTDPVNSGPMIDPLMQLLYASSVLHDTRICVMGYNVPGEAADVQQAISLWEGLSHLKPTLAIQGYGLNTDPTPAVIKFVNAGCQAVSISADIDTGPPFMKAVGTQNAVNKVQWMMGLATYSPQFAQAVGSSGNGLLMGLEFASFQDPASAPMLAQFAAAGIPDSMTEVTGWTAAYAFTHIADTIKGPITKDSFTAAAKSIQPFNIPSMGTPFSFGSGSRHNPNQAAYWVRLNNGTFSDVSTNFLTLPLGTVPR